MSEDRKTKLEEFGEACGKLGWALMPCSCSCLTMIVVAAILFLGGGLVTLLPEG